jgi:hypothetical protein
MNLIRKNDATEKENIMILFKQKILVKKLTKKSILITKYFDDVAEFIQAR